VCDVVELAVAFLVDWEKRKKKFCVKQGNHSDEQFIIIYISY
jgi:hypothetical protein